MSKDEWIFKMEDEEEDSNDDGLEPLLKSKVNQIFWKLRLEATYREENNDSGMADRYRQEIDDMERKDQDAYERACSKFTNFLEEEEEKITGQFNAKIKAKETKDDGKNGKKKENKNEVKNLKKMTGKQEADLVK
jgi:hypothetical protein